MTGIGPHSPGMPDDTTTQAATPTPAPFDDALSAPHWQPDAATAHTPQPETPDLTEMPASAPASADHDGTAPPPPQSPAASDSAPGLMPDPSGAGAPPASPPPPAPPGTPETPETPHTGPDSGHDADHDETGGHGGGEPMGLMDHLSELRARLVRCCIAVCVGFLLCWAFVDPIFNILIQPLLSVLPDGTHAQYTTLPEAFFTRMYIAFVAGVFLASPAIFYQVWAFVAPGLYDEEKRYIVPIALLSALFFIAGGAFCYFIVFPFAFSFFVSFSTPEIVITPKVSDYLSFVLKLLIAFGLIFEMPIFTLFLARMGLLTAGMMRRGRRYAIVGIFILAAILTPPDVVSQLLMACPMLLLYEASIGVAALFGRRKKPESAAAAADRPEGTAAGAHDVPHSPPAQGEPCPAAGHDADMPPMSDSSAPRASKEDA